MTPKLFAATVLAVVFAFVSISRADESGVNKQTADGAPGVVAGTGLAIAPKEDVDVGKMAAEAIAEAKKSFGTTAAAKVVLIAENIATTDAHTKVILGAIREAFGADVPIAGVRITWGDYTPHTLEELPDSNEKRSIALMALGGADIAVQVVLGAADLNTNSNEQAVIAGEKLAKALKVKKNARNLLLVMGPMHTPLNEHVDAGIKKVLGTPLPGNVRIVGWATSYWGGSAYANGKLTPPGKALLGVLITGDFEWAFRGMAQPRGWPKAPNDIGNFAQEIVKELGGKPDATFVVLGHPRRTLWAKIRDNLELALGKGAAVFGHHAGAESGHFATDTDSKASASHFFIAGIRGKKRPADEAKATP